MIKRHTLWPVLSIALILSLVAGPFTAGAQTPPPLPEVYTWEAYGFSVRYPSDWTVDEGDTVISLHPANRDVSDGTGPELVLFVQANTGTDQFDTMIEAFTATINGDVSETAAGTFEGYPIRVLTFDQVEPDTIGGITLIAIENQTMLGVAYTMRDNEMSVYTPIFEAMHASMTFSAPLATPTGESSISIASIQLPQPYIWQETGLRLFLPEDWTIETEDNADGLTVILSPPLAPVGEEQRLNMVHCSTLDWSTSLSLRDVARSLAVGSQDVSEVVDITVAGQAGVTFEFSDTSEEPVLRLRALLIGLPDRQLAAMILFGAPEGEWDTFRPTVDAFIANMEHVDASQSSVIPDPNHPIRARAYWLPDDQRPTLRQEDDPETPFHWEEFGVTFTIPDDWRASIGGTDYDLALLSPETMAGENGAYITFRYFASLGPDTTLEAALEPIAEQFESDVQPYNRSGLEGAEVVSQDDETGTVYHLILVPYDTHGAALYIQTVAPADEDIAVLAILDSMIINPVKPDVSALDAAWQQSLADDGAFIYGDDDAPVHMLEFLDFSCGHCANYSAAVDRLVALEVEQGRLQLELRLHSGVGGELSYQATMATYCAAEQGKGYTAYKTLFWGDMQQGRDFAYSREGIDELLGQPEIGLDMDALNACIDNDKYANAIQLNWAYANSVGANFTPAVLLATGDDEPAFLTLPDGEIWSGGVPLQVLRIVIDGVISDHKSIPEILDEVFGTSTESTESTDTGATTIEEEGAETAEPDESGDEAVQPEATEAAEDVEAPEAAETPAPTEEAVAQPEATEDAAAASEDATSGEGGEDDDGGLSAGVIVAVAAGIAVAIGAAIASQRKRTAAPDDNSSKSKDA